MDIMLPLRPKILKRKKNKLRKRHAVYIKKLPVSLSIACVYTARKVFISSHFQCSMKNIQNECEKLPSILKIDQK